eukprot:7567987-Ditylum_brightwellii.AAC.1
MSERYLMLYNAMVDKRGKVLFNADQKDGKLKAKIEYAANTKVGSNRKAYCVRRAMQRIVQILTVL